MYNPADKREGVLRYDRYVLWKPKVRNDNQARRRLDDHDYTGETLIIRYMYILSS